MAETLDHSRLQTAESRPRKRGSLPLVAVAVVTATITATVVGLIAFIALTYGFAKRPISAATSPDKQYTAAVYQRSGFPARNATFVSVRPSLSSPNSREARDVFVIDGPQGVGVFWSGERELTVVCVACGHHMYAQHEERWRDVAVKVVSYDADSDNSR